MSTLDNAFIRAYARDHAEAPQELRAAEHVEPVNSRSSEELVTTRFFDVENTYVIAEFVGDDLSYRLDTGVSAATEVESAVPAPHVDFSKVSPAKESQLSDSMNHEFPPSDSTNHEAAPVPEFRVDPGSEPALTAPHFIRKPQNSLVAVAVPVGPMPDSQKPLSIRIDGGDQSPAFPLETIHRTAESRVGQWTVPPAKRNFKTVWEVDRLLWPSISEQLLNNESPSLESAGVRLRAAAHDGLNVLAITSRLRGEGRSTIAQCLARTVAKAGATVALLDADVWHPELANQTGLEVTCGWDEVVLGGLPLEEVAVTSIDDHLTLIPLGDVSQRTNLALHDRRVTLMIQEIAEQFDLVIIDMGPVGDPHRQLFESGDSCPIDAAMVVRDVRLTSLEEAHTVAARLCAAGIQSVGVVENFLPRWEPQPNS